MNETNNYVAPKGDYKLVITDRQTGEEILELESEDQQELLTIIDQYDRKKFSHILMGKDIFLAE